MLTLARVLRSPRLPSLPAAAVRLLELSRESSSGAADYVKVVESDPAIAAKLLKLANSSFFAQRSEIASVQRAVVLLGLNTVTSMALSFSVARSTTGKGPLAAHFQTYWQRSVLQATAAEVMTGRLTGADRSELFLLGLMLDIGQLAMLCTAGKTYGELLDEAAESSQSLVEIEEDAFDFTHATVGSALLESWQFPESLVTLVGEHHDSNDTTTDGGKLDEKQRLVRLLAALGDYFFPASATEARETLLARGQALFGFDPPAVDELLEEIVDRFRSNAELFDADPDDLPDPSEIMAMVNEQLAAKAVLAAAGQEETERARRQIEEQKSRIEQQKTEIEQQKVALEQENEELREKVTEDPLTGLFNRRYLDEALASELDLAQRTGKPLGLLFMDIDKFKTLNDTYGHRFGDEVLQAVAERVRVQIRPSDIPARYGGEEFVVLARQPTEPGLRTLAERIREGVESLTLDCDGTPVPVTVSIGAAHAIPRRVDPQLAERLVAEADAAMYEAKNAGRNRCRIRSLLSNSQVELNQIVTSRRFSLWLVRRGVIDAAEASQALTRSLPPGERIGELAEEYGFLSREQIDELLAAQIEGNMGQRVGELAIERGFLNSTELATLLALQTESPSRVAQTLVRAGCLGPQQVAELHHEYLNEILPASLVEQVAAQPATV